MKATVTLSLGVVGAVLTSVGAVLPAQALTININFDDLPGNDDDIPANYQGFTWTNFAYLNPPTVWPNGSGYQNGTVSGDKVAFNAFGNPASFSSTIPFSLDNASLTGAWNNGLNVTVQGFLGTTELYTQTVTVNTSSPTLFNFNFSGIDRVQFSSFGGTNAGFVDSSGQLISGTQFALDNLSVTPIPVPPQLLGTVIAGGLGVLKMRKRQRALAAQQSG